MEDAEHNFYPGPGFKANYFQPMTAQKLDAKHTRPKNSVHTINVANPFPPLYPGNAGKNKQSETLTKQRNFAAAFETSGEPMINGFPSRHFEMGDSHGIPCAYDLYMEERQRRLEHGSTEAELHEVVKVCYNFITPVGRMVFGEAANRQREAWLKLSTTRAYSAKNYPTAFRKAAENRYAARLKDFKKLPPAIGDPPMGHTPKMIRRPDPFKHAHCISTVANTFEELYLGDNPKVLVEIDWKCQVYLIAAFPIEGVFRSMYLPNHWLVTIYKEPSRNFSAPCIINIKSFDKEGLSEYRIREILGLEAEDKFGDYIFSFF